MCLHSREASSTQKQGHSRQSLKKWRGAGGERRQDNERKGGKERENETKNGEEKRMEREGREKKIRRLKKSEKITTYWPRKYLSKLAPSHLAVHVHRVTACGCTLGLTNAGIQCVCTTSTTCPRPGESRGGHLGVTRRVIPPRHNNCKRHGSRGALQQVVDVIHHAIHHLFHKRRVSFK